MKLYTEEQVKNALYEGFYLAMVSDGGLKEFEEQFINSLTPIELPTEEEVYNAAKLKTDHSDILPSAKTIFLAGIKSAINHIYSQINKQI